MPVDEKKSLKIDGIWDWESNGKKRLFTQDADPHPERRGVHVRNSGQQVDVSVAVVSHDCDGPDRGSDCDPTTGTRTRTI